MTRGEFFCDQYRNAISEKAILTKLPLDGLRVLVLEDEFLIAMEVEQACRDSGAADVRICRTLEEVGSTASGTFDFDVAVIDLKLGLISSLDFARGLHEAGVPFIFATGYADSQEMSENFPGVRVVTKPYLGNEVVDALADTLHRVPQRLDFD